MHRNKIIKLLEDYALDYPSEEESTSLNQKFVKIHPNCFKRTLQIGHVISSAWVISQDFQEVLLTHHRKLNIWIQMGGMWMATLILEKKFSRSQRRVRDKFDQTNVRLTV